MPYLNNSLISGSMSALDAKFIPNSVIPYNGERTAAGITEFGMNLASSADIDPEINELFK
jgi:hypothetical protein